LQLERRADGYDILSGASGDCDGNTIPDECDIATGTADCNANGVPDACDLASGSSHDLNTNGLPDECEPNLTWHVDDDAAPGGNGSAAAPFQTINQGVHAAVSGDTVVVHDGLYLIGDGSQDLHFHGKDIAVRSEQGPVNCIVDGQGTAHAFMFLQGETSAASLEGLTIRNAAYSPAALESASRTPVRPSATACSKAAPAPGVQALMSSIARRTSRIACSATTPCCRASD
jgi:hypothetical protein